MKVRVVLSSPEQHPISAMPKALRNILYFNDDLLSLIDWNGCPNSGCEHKLAVSGERRDVIGWLDLFLEAYPDTKPEIHAIKLMIKQKFINDPDRQITVTLRNLNKFHDSDNGIVEKHWFWTKD